MGAVEIIIIIIGIICIAGSFFVPEGTKGVEISIPDEIVRDIIEKETKKAIFQIEEHTEETVSSIKEKTERSMEKLSNEKIMAIDEFSNTILEKIYKNHEEAVFLYDMLSNKHIQLKNTIGELEKGIHSYRQETSITREDREAVQQAETEEKELNVREIASKSSLLNEISTGVAGRERVQETATEDNDNTEEVKLPYEKEEENTGEEKDLILKYHKAGKSDVEIAKILSMGVGEVKLIIGLFEGRD